jgi:uncharacterized protein (DUF1778 family)
MRKRMGRPTKIATGKFSTITVRIPADKKNLITNLADGYDMTITEYLLTLVERDAFKTPTR